jgi:hypothetical protein
MGDYFLKRRVGNSEKYSEEGLAFVQAAFDYAKISIPKGNQSPECYGANEIPNPFGGPRFCVGPGDVKRGWSNYLEKVPQVSLTGLGAL